MAKPLNTIRTRPLSFQIALFLKQIYVQNSRSILGKIIVERVDVSHGGQVVIGTVNGGAANKSKI